MATVINNPSERTPESTGTGVVVGILFIVLLLVLFLVFGLPYLRTQSVPQDSTTNLNVELPSIGGGADAGGGTGNTGTGGTNANPAQ